MGNVQVLKAGVAIDTCDYAGNTLLHHAVCFCRSPDP